jgi:ABC-type multidrug transport system fused ATPase/permease subunit
MNDVERVDEYGQLASERYAARGDNQAGWTSYDAFLGAAAAAVPGAREPPPAWPADGRLVFDHLRLCYPSNPRAPVLKDLSFAVAGRQRVGIVGCVLWEAAGGYYPTLARVFPVRAPFV